jgi:hypothetical protein
MTEEEIESIVAEATPIFKREVKNRIDRLVQEKYETPIRKLQAMKEQKRLQKRERKAEDTLVEVEAKAEPVVV